MAYINCEECYHAKVCLHNSGDMVLCEHWQPTADVVEVVKCKDCIHWWSPMEDDFHYCRLKTGLGGLVTKEDYCSFATRTPKERGGEK